VKRILQEALLVALAGALLAFAANGLSARGLKLGRDYFPVSQRPAPPAGESNAPPSATVTTNDSAFAALAARFASEGLQLADGEHIRRLYHDPKRAHELILFIDARPEDQYLAGHIPGAYYFDRFHPENHLPTLAPLCLNAEQIVFYCTGGDCEESEFAAKEVRDGMGLPQEKIFVYAGGMAEWRSLGMPVETGTRNSGVITNTGGAH
jgi:rhodanese-related sulfurtransferase